MRCAVRCSWYATQLRSTMRSHTFIGHRSTAKKFVPRRHCQPLNSFGQERPPPRQSRQTCATLHKRRTCGAEMFVAGTRTALLPTYATTISPLATRWPLSPHRRAPPFLEHRDSHADAGPAPLIMFPPRGCGPKCSNRNIQLVVALVLPRVLVMSGPGSIRGSTLMGMIVCVA